MPVVPNKDIFRLQVTVDDISSVQVLKSQDELCDVEPNSILIDSSALDGHHREVAPRTVVENHVDVVRGLESVVQPENKRVVARLQYI